MKRCLVVTLMAVALAASQLCGCGGESKDASSSATAVLYIDAAGDVHAGWAEGVYDVYQEIDTTTSNAIMVAASGSTQAYMTETGEIYSRSDSED